MSIKIEGGEGTEENVIKSGASNELLYNDKEVLLKENFDLDLKLLPPDLTKTQEWKLKTNKNSNPFIVPEDGWIVKVEFMAVSNYKLSSDYIKIDDFGELGVTPSQIFLGKFENYNINGGGTGDRSNVTYNSNCPYLVKEGQLVESSENTDISDVTVTFAPCMSV